jgi:hypothetical protein
MSPKLYETHKAFWRSLHLVCLESLRHSYRQKGNLTNHLTDNVSLLDALSVNGLLALANQRVAYTTH